MVLFFLNADPGCPRDEREDPQASNSKDPPRVLSYPFRHFGDGHTLQLRKLFDHLNDIRRFISLSAIWRRSEVWSIRF